ncbi:MAG: hypothetical protein JNM57_13915 [Cyclobacteriaceae bacterium]|nr:hypothetical protein [Cyclobacteriaceae bacterium]
MIKTGFSIVLSCLFVPVLAQLGHEWINYNQEYYKIPVAKNGLYKVRYTDLQQAGVPVNTVNPQTFQLFHRGVEQAIYVEGEGDAQFNPADFIEFYGRKNDGTLDAELYQPATVQPHTFYNLYNDTTSYFLTFHAQAGKRMPTFSEANSSGIPKESSHQEEILVILKEQYATGFTTSDVQHAFFDQGEGWTGIQITQNQFRDYLLTDLVKGVPSDGLPQLKILLVGRWSVSHQAEIYVGPDASSLRLLGNAPAFSSYQTTTFSHSFNWTDIAADGKLTVRIRATGANDRLSASYIQVNFPQRVDASGLSEKLFVVNESPAEKSYIEIENPSPGMRLFDVTDPANVITIGTSGTTTLHALVQSAAVPRKLFATSMVLTTSIKRVTFRQIIPSQHNFIIISNRLLMKPASGYSNPVKAYAEYRASAEGGGYDTLVVEMQLLFNQFNYGETSPLAIYHFMKFLAASHIPDYLFLIGKGLSVNYGYYRNPAGFTTYKDFVPSAGMPAADMLFTAGLGSTTYEPAVPTGRIPATTPVQVAAYLNKVKETESMAFNTLWRKDILHLSGGIELGEPEYFRQILGSFQTVAEDYHLGGSVTPIAKQSREILQDIDVSKQVNAGLNLITFFGHSSAGTLDFDIGFVSNPVLGYNNKGKYPMFLINGCNAGSFFLNGQIWGEDWINAENKGAVGFIAHTYFGLVGTLQKYSDVFYRVGYGDSTYIQKGIGDIQKEVARQYMSTSAPSIVNVTQVQQMLLLGDPAVKLFGAKKPDYDITGDNLSIESFNGLPVTALSDSFALKMIVRNFGQAKEGNFRIEVKRTFNDNSVVIYDSLFAPVLYSDTIRFIIRKERNPGYGNNILTVTIDPDGIIPELTKANNTASVNFFIPSNGTRNLFPYPYAIVNEKQVNLSWQSTDLLSGERDFSIELDTVNTFTSPFRKQFNTTGTVLARQLVSLLDQDSVAYYWRTKLADPMPGESTEWTMSSFTYIQDSPEGWAQLHFPQYLENASEGLVYDSEIRELTYPETVTDVAIRIFGASKPTVITDYSVKIAGAEYNLVTQGFVCRYNTLNLIAFDRRSTVPYIGVPFKWYNRAGRACGREPWVINSFAPAEMVTGNNDDIIAYVNNIAAGDSVVLYTIGDAGYASWPLAAKTKLGELGISISQLDNLLPGEPVVIFGRKGLAPGSATVFRSALAPADQQELLVNKTITGRYTSGMMTSVPIGPALHWKELFSTVKHVEAFDVHRIDVIGVKLNGDETLLFPDIQGNLNLSAIDPVTYPSLKLRFKAEDNVNLTPAQLKKWIVTYDPVPEGMLIFEGPGAQQVLVEGQTWKGRFGFVNISDKQFTSPLDVTYQTFNTTTRTSVAENFSIASPAPGDTTWFQVEFNSFGKSGFNDVVVFVNQRIVPEQYYDNNVLQMNEYLHVVDDRYIPVMDVTIDGRLVANGDFVSPNPVIEIRLWDENRYLLKADTTNIKLFLTYPCSSGTCIPTPIYFSRSDVQWFAATASADFRIVFKPRNLEEGEYTLRISAADARGNVSEGDYEVMFVVDYASAVSISYPYPNPFALSTTFRVKISGEKEPDSFSLVMLDVNGKVVRDLNDDNTTPLIIGTNEIFWDGASDNGTPVAAGLYLFRLVILYDGQSYTKLGKVVVVR